MERGSKIVTVVPHDFKLVLQVRGTSLTGKESLLAHTHILPFPPLSITPPASDASG